MTVSTTVRGPRTRGTTNSNSRGSASDRARRRSWLMGTYASDHPGYVRCYRCGGLLFNPDDRPLVPPSSWPIDALLGAQPLTVDRIIPGCQGGTYRRNNIRPACGMCNSETGGGTRSGGGR